MSWSSQTWNNVTGAVLSGLSAIALVLGAIWGAGEYLSYGEEKRVTNTLEMVARYNSDALLDARIKADEAWQISAPDLGGLANTSNPILAYERLVLNMIDEENLGTSIRIILGFLDEIVICVETDLCHKPTVDGYFLDSGQSFIRKFYPYVCEQRNIWNDDSIWLEAQDYFNPNPRSAPCASWRS